MKNTIIATLVASSMVFFGTITNQETQNNDSKLAVIAPNKTLAISIKLKNDTGAEMSVKNENSGGSYRLSKNTVVTIKMDEGDKLYVSNGGKKGRLLLTASASMDGKVQLVSKL